MSRDIRSIILYGTLRRDLLTTDRFSLSDHLSFEGHCTLTGTLHDLGPYPGFVAQGDNAVTAEVHRLDDPSILKTLDAYEDFFEHDHASSLYHRRAIDLGPPHGQAWLYVFNAERPGIDLADFPVVESGDWAVHLKTRRTRQAIGASTSPP